MIYTITPSLILDLSSDASPMGADELGSAVTHINAGGTVVVNSIRSATRVLHGLGLADREIDDRLVFALTGQVLIMDEAT